MQDDRRYPRQTTMGDGRSAAPRRPARLDELDYNFNDPENLINRRFLRSRTQLRNPVQYTRTFPQFGENYYDQDNSYFREQRPSFVGSALRPLKTVANESRRRVAAITDRVSDMVTKTSDTIGNVGTLLASNMDNIHTIANDGIDRLRGIGDGMTNRVLNVMDKSDQIYNSNNGILSNTLDNMTELATNGGEVTLLDNDDYYEDRLAQGNI